MASKDPKNAYDALCLLDIAALDTRWDDIGEEVRLILKHWAVQTALNRRGLGKLDAYKVMDIKNNMLDAASLVWPRKFRT